MADLDFVHLHVHSSYSLLEGALHHRAAGRARQGRPAAGAGAHRHRQHVRRARILREARRRRHPAHRRLRARRSISATPSTALRNGNAPPAAPAHRAAGRARARLPQPDAAVLARLPRHAGARAAARSSSTGSKARPTASSRSPAAPAARSIWRSPPARAISPAAPARRAARTVRRPALCRIAAPRHGERARTPSRADRSRLWQGRAAGRHQRAVFRHRAGLRSA